MEKETGSGAARPTMADVARELGVAKITVSRALSDSTTVKESTRRLIRETAERMGYRLNVSARNLRQQRSRTIAVVIEMAPSHDRLMSEPYPLSLLGGIMQILTGAGQNMVLTTLELFLQHPPSVDGVILLGQGVHDDAAGAIAQTGLPYVVWGAAHGPPERVVVGSDNHEGGRLAAAHLLAAGRRRLLFLGDAEHGEAEDRLAGFEAGLAGSDAVIVDRLTATFTVAAGRAAVAALLARGSDFDGVFAASDAIAMGAIEALQAAGRNVPGDVSVIGFDDSPGAAIFTPKLTTIRQNWAAGGELLAAKVLELVAGRASESHAMAVDLILRES
ncbi:MAG: substrate-binding domain-containing protein [Sphingopyxis sp.]|uniref:substrate-binding domain-containing protein n=1 Tax=Sphingopyxis sp. TaxID=1908224 RepID=UPI002ABBC764|nr:substrate-binding domain-containing protein [Sphingopyxis sp.]MDZ3832209.1 substrate-binding domain-containing protein [Sphingopyxis sp.]